MTVVVVFQVARMASLESASTLMELTFASDFALEFTLGKNIVRLGKEVRLGQVRIGFLQK
jgi:hypothetical protein